MTSAAPAAPGAGVERLADDEIQVWLSHRAPRPITHRAPPSPAHEGAWARGLLARYLGVPAATLRFTRGPFGKPAVVRATGQPALEFSLSHSGDRIALAVARHPVGIDLERLGPLPDLDGLVDIALDAAERQACLAVPAGLREAFFHRLWTRKEACLKAAGTGLVDRLAEIGTLDAAGLARLGGIAQVRDWQPVAGYHLAVASTRSGMRVVQRASDPGAMPADG